MDTEDDISASTRLPLPTPRRFLTSLIASLPTNSQAYDYSTSEDEKDEHGRSDQKTPLPLPPDAQPILATLHVLYPSLVLPALDLLDRRLVTRVIEVRKTNSTDEATKTAAIPSEEIPAAPQVEAQAVSITQGEQSHLQESQLQSPIQACPEVSPSTSNLPQNGNSRPHKNSIFIVRSAQQQLHHRRSSSKADTGPHSLQPSAFSTSGGAGRTYIVRPNAWNCSCAAFAFAAFPARGSERWRDGLKDLQDTKRIGEFTRSRKGGVYESSNPKAEAGLGEHAATQPQMYPEGPDEGGEGGHIDTTEDHNQWSFGGLSLNGRYGTANDDIGGHGSAEQEITDDEDGQDVPCCKHLLACVLADRWRSVLRGYVRTIKVGRMEMAGLASET